MQVTVNGKQETLDAEMTVVELLRALGIEARGIAVAINGAIVRRSEHAQARIHESDKVEIIRAFGGG